MRRLLTAACMAMLLPLALPDPSTGAPGPGPGTPVIVPYHMEENGIARRDTDAEGRNLTNAYDKEVWDTSTYAAVSAHAQAAVVTKKTTVAVWYNTTHGVGTKDKGRLTLQVVWNLSFEPDGFQCGYGVSLLSGYRSDGDNNSAFRFYDTAINTSGIETLQFQFNGGAADTIRDDGTVHLAVEVTATDPGLACQQVTTSAGIYDVAVLRSNTPPMTRLAPPPQMMLVGDPVAFDARNSSDNDTDPLDFLFDFNDTAGDQWQAGAVFNRTFSRRGDYILTVTAREQGTAHINATGDAVTAGFTVHEYNLSVPAPAPVDAVRGAGGNGSVAVANTGDLAANISASFAGGPGWVTAGGPLALAPGGNGNIPLAISPDAPRGNYSLNLTLAVKEHNATRRTVVVPVRVHEYNFSVATPAPIEALRGAGGTGSIQVTGTGDLAENLTASVEGSPSWLAAGGPVALQPGGSGAIPLAVSKDAPLGEYALNVTVSVSEFPSVSRTVRLLVTVQEAQFTVSPQAEQAVGLNPGYTQAVIYDVTNTGTLGLTISVTKTSGPDWAAPSRSEVILGAGAKEGVSLTLSPPAGMTPGSYPVILLFSTGQPLPLSVNRSVAVTLANAPMPSIQILDARVNNTMPAVGGEVNFSATVSNIGSADSGPMAVDFRWQRDGGPAPATFSTTTINVPKEGGSVPVSSMWGTGGLEPGNYTLTVAVGSRVAEVTGIRLWVFTAVSENLPPFIVSTPPASATAGVEYQYQVRAGDPNLDALNYTLPASPKGMAVDSRGLIEWVPSQEQAGNNAVSLGVSDGKFTVFQNFTVTVTVTGMNHIPVIRSTPPAGAVAGVPFTYLLDATDEDGDRLSFSLDSAPAGMAVGALSGVVAWTPAESQAGSVVVAVVASDGRGYAVQRFTLAVTVNRPPRFIGAPPAESIVLGRSFTYQIDCRDDEGAPLRFAFDLRPAGMTIDGKTGLVSWKPEAAGNYTFAVNASDGTRWATQSFNLTVVRPVAKVSGGGQPSPLPLVAAIAAVAAVAGGAAAYLARRRRTMIDDLFFIARDGRLIAHEARRLKPSVDPELLSGMLVAIQDFSAQATKGTDAEGAYEMTHGRWRFLVARGRQCLIAVLITGPATGTIKRRLQETLDEVEKKYGAALAAWDGEISAMGDAVAVVRRMLD